MPMNSRKDKQILKAYRLLFSHENNINIDSIKSLNIKIIKSAYRMKALETHPDRAKLLGINENVLTIKFNEISKAYKDLYEFICCHRGSATGSMKSRHQQKYTASPDKDKDRTGQKYTYSGKKQKDFYSGEKTQDSRERKGPEKTGEPKGKNTRWIIKNHKLLFGQYLFFSGLITFSTLLDAIFWQRKQRDLFGKIASNWGILNSDDILTILRGRKPLEKFGDCALRLGFINQLQHRAILFKQSKMQKQLGEYFVKNGIISRRDLQSILLEYKKYQMKN